MNKVTEAILNEYVVVFIYFIAEHNAFRRFVFFKCSKKYNKVDKIKKIELKITRTTTVNRWDIIINNSYTTFNKQVYKKSFVVKSFVKVVY